MSNTERKDIPFMNKTERQQEILRLLASEERIEITELCNIFHIVPMTARRDLSELEEQGKLIRTHGGAALPPGKEDVNLPFFQRTIRLRNWPLPLKHVLLSKRGSIFSSPPAQRCISLPSLWIKIFL